MRSTVPYSSLVLCFSLLLYSSTTVTAIQDQLDGKIDLGIHKGDRSLLSSSQVDLDESLTIAEDKLSTESTFILKEEDQQDTNAVEPVDHTWLITDEVLVELGYDLQPLLDRSESDDVFLFDVDLALQFTKSLTIDHNLTFMTKPGRSTTKVTCPEYGSLFKIKSLKFKLSDFTITNCKDSKGAPIFRFFPFAVGIFDSIVCKDNLVRVFYVPKNGSLSVKNSTFQNNSLGGFSTNDPTEQRGAVLKATRTKSLRFRDSIFKDNAAPNHGGVFSVYVSPMSIKGCRFENNSAPNSIGGAIQGYRFLKLAISYSIFKDNKAEQGGAIYARYKSTLNIVRSLFEGNSASKIGGGIYINGSSTLRLKDSTFSTNEAVEAGATYVGSESVGSIFNCLFSNNSATIRGGGVSTTNSSKVSISSSKFLGNVATFGGGVHISRSSEGVIEGSHFEENDVSGDGGGIYTIEASHLSIAHSLFHKNNATHGGAFMVNRFSQGEVKWSNFTNNTSSKQAGAAKVNRNSTLAVTTSIFFYCSSSYGGVMIAEHDSNLTVDSSLFENNTASGNGGAINLWLGSKAEITNITLFGSSAPYGGAIYIEKNCTFSGDASLFQDNIAKFGAVIFVQVYSSAEISDSSFDGNIATRYGGAAYVIKSSNFSVSYSNFTENTQTYEGVFRAALTSNATFTNCSFDGAPPSSSQDEEEPTNGFSHCPSSI